MSEPTFLQDHFAAKMFSMFNNFVFPALEVSSDDAAALQLTAASALASSDQKLSVLKFYPAHPTWAGNSELAGF